MEEQCQQKSSIFFVFSVLFCFLQHWRSFIPLSHSHSLSLSFSLYMSLHHFPPVLKNIHSGAFIILCLAQKLFKDCSLTLAWRAEVLQSETWNVEKLCIFEFWCPHLPPAAVSQRGWKLWMLCGQCQPPLTLELMIALTVGGRHVTCIFFSFFWSLPQHHKTCTSFFALFTPLGWKWLPLPRSSWRLFVQFDLGIWW